MQKWPQTAYTITNATCRSRALGSAGLPVAVHTANGFQSGGTTPKKAQATLASKESLSKPKQIQRVRENLTTRKPEVLCLYRSLLRECTYLPDPNARSYLRQQVVARFREYCPRWDAPKPTRERRKTPQLVEGRQTVVIKTARKALRTLRRANQGYLKHLEKVLALTYGRTGRRRHELLVPTKTPDIPPNHTAVELLSQQSLHDKRLSDLPPQLHALLHSQMKQRSSNLPSTRIKESRPQIPETNAWGRPMPKSRIKNIERRWYAKTIDRIMAPLPEKEWNFLENYALGRTKWEGPVRRRKSSGEERYKGGGPDVPANDDGGSYLPTRIRRELGCPHILTQRTMRRLWQNIFVQCPMMQWDISKSRWSVKWGNIGRSKEIVFEQQKSPDTSLFAGVDETGKKIPD